MSDGSLFSTMSHPTTDQDFASTTRPSPLIGKVFHPTNLAEWHEAAFAHALRIAYAAHAELTVLHVHKESHSIDWSEFPHVRDTLIRWNMISASASHADVHHAGLDVKKIQARRDDPVEAITQHLEKSPTDLVVMATHQTHGLARILHGSVAEPIARKCQAATLFLPMRLPGFVSVDTGRVSLRRILIPVDWKPDPRAGIKVAIQLASLLGMDDVDYHLLHVTHGQPSLPLETIPSEGHHVRHSTVHGSPVDEILRLARDDRTDLVVMTTRGHHGFLGGLRGSTMERVVRGASCPVLAVPEKYLVREPIP